MSLTTTVIFFNSSVEAFAPGLVPLEESGRDGPRIASARSKVGTERAAIVDEIVLDVAVDLELVFPAAWRALGDGGEATVLAAVREAAEHQT